MRRVAVVVGLGEGEGVAVERNVIAGKSDGMSVASGIAVRLAFCTTICAMLAASVAPTSDETICVAAGIVGVGDIERVAVNLGVTLLTAVDV